MSHALHFYDEPESGCLPAKDMLEGLSDAKQHAARIALSKILAEQGLNVCDTEWGKALGRGLYEFRIRHDGNEILRDRDPALLDKIGPLPAEPTLLRVFFSVDKDTIVLLLAGYDKGRDPSRKRQDREIAAARARLTEYKARTPKKSARPGRRTPKTEPFRAWWADKVRALDRVRRSR